MVGICKFFITVVPWAFWIVIALFVFVAVPLLIIRRARGVGLGIIYFLVFCMIAVAWCNAFVLTYAQWGAVGVVVGLVLAAFGLIPVGLLAALFAGDWLNLFMLGLQCVLCIGWIWLCYKIAEKTAETSVAA